MPCKVFHEKRALLPPSTFICSCSNTFYSNISHQKPPTWPWISYLRCFQRMTHPPVSHLRPAEPHPMRPGLWGQWQGPRSLWWSGQACPALIARYSLPAGVQTQPARLVSNQTQKVQAIQTPSKNRSANGLLLRACQDPAQKQCSFMTFFR